MRLPVIPVEGDEKWELLRKIIEKLETRETKKALARYKITPVNNAIKFLKIIILAMFFELEISYAVIEVNKRLELRKFLRIDEDVKLRSVYSFMSKFKEETFTSFVFSILNVNSKRRRKKHSLLILDWTDITLDLYPLILEMLKRRKLIRFGDAIIMDKGFYGYKNYLIGIKHGIVPLIIPKKNFRLERLEGMLSYPLTIFNSKNVEEEKRRYRELVKRLFKGLKKNLKSLRAIVEDESSWGKRLIV